MELYIHLPFCRSKCRYCDFASWPGQESAMSGYVDCLLQEAACQVEALGGDVAIDTVFLGGGTPSLLPAPLLEKLLRGMRGIFRMAPDAECTVEANPGTLLRPWLDAALEGGVNRLSLGMQAFQPKLLRTLGRIHDFEQVASSVRLAREAGVTNLSLDLMFGLPGQTRAMWRETLDAALSLSPQHLSCYGLIPEDGTPLKVQLDQGLLRLPEEDEERAMYDDALRILAAHGFAQYEISNFALPGYACRHNLGYWRQIPYLGLGASAASMLPAAWRKEGKPAYWRASNPRTLADYQAMVRERAWDRRDIEAVSSHDARFETMMLGLRTTRGVSEADFSAMHDVTLESCYGPRLRALQARGWLDFADGRWFLTRQGMDVQNAALVELMDD